MHCLYLIMQDKHFDLPVDFALPGIVQYFVFHEICFILILFCEKYPPGGLIIYKNYDILDLNHLRRPGRRNGSRPIKCRSGRAVNPLRRGAWNGPGEAENSAGIMV